MQWIKWLRIIAEILLLIARGFSKSSAVGAVALKYNVSVSEIIKELNKNKW